MDFFNLMDTSFYNRMELITKANTALYDQETSESSDFEFSGGSSATLTAPPPPPISFSGNLSSIHQTQNFPFIQENTEIPHDFTTAVQRGDHQYSMEAMRETIFRVAMMQPVQIDSEPIKPPPRRKNVRISKDPQSVAARRRRERISERIRVLQRMVPGGTKLDTASMLDEAVHYLKFLKKEVKRLLEEEEEAVVGNRPPPLMMGGGGLFSVLGRGVARI